MNFSTGLLAAVANEPSMLFVALMGMGTVLIGLTCIIFLCMLMGKIIGATTKEETPAPAPTPAAPVAAANAAIPNRGEILAAVTAAVAEELGTDVSALRVLSFKRVDAAPAGGAHGELVAAVSAAVAEDMGTDASKIRIHSMKKIG